MKRVHYLLVVALPMILGPRAAVADEATNVDEATGADAARLVVSENSARQFASGLQQVRNRVSSIIRRAGGRRGGGENDLAAQNLTLTAENELTDASNDALAAAQDASVGNIFKANAELVSACTKSAWAATHLARAAFAALRPPHGSWTPFSIEITQTMQDLNQLRQDVGC